MKLERFLPWAAGALALAAALFAAAPPGKVNGFDLDGFARLPVLDGGRVKPIDSVARNSLLLIRSQQSFRYDGRTVGADEWLLDVLFRPQVADAQPVFVINDPDVLGLLGLRQTSDRYFSFATIAPHLAEVEQQAMAAQRIDTKQRTRFQGAVVNLFERVYLYYKLKNSVQLTGAQPLAAELKAVRAPGAEQRHAALAELAAFRPLPPLAGQSPDAWRNVGEALRQGAAGATLHPGLDPLARIGAAWGFAFTRRTSLPASYWVSSQSFVSLLNATVHSSFPGIVTIDQVPAASFCPSTVTSSERVIVVAAFAPVRQGLSQGTRSPQIVRPRTLGRL